MGGLAAACTIGAAVLGCEPGVRKPDPRTAEPVCAGLGPLPRSVVVVGGDRWADGRAAALGCAFHPAGRLPADRRPSGLRPVLDLVAGAGRSAW